MFLPAEVVGVRIEMPSNQPIVLLKESNGGRYLPIWIGALEAGAIAIAIAGTPTPRPMTHDLMREILEVSGTFVTSVHITGMEAGLFFAEIHLRDENGALAPISARPSDAIALALRTQANVMVASDLFETAGIAVRSDEGSEGEVEAFRQFLDEINPDDF